MKLSRPNEVYLMKLSRLNVSFRKLINNVNVVRALLGSEECIGASDAGLEFIVECNTVD